MMPEARGLAKLSIYEFGSIGPHITQRMFELSEKINSFLQQNIYDGIIVTHGTDTARRDGLFLDLTLETKIPIVVIGAENKLEQLGRQKFSGCDSYHQQS